MYLTKSKYLVFICIFGLTSQPVYYFRIYAKRKVNRSVDNIFYRLGYVETFVTGIGRIMDSYEQYSKKPNFDLIETTFSITLPNNYKANIVTPSLSQEDIIINYLKEYNKINR